MDDNNDNPIIIRPHIVFTDGHQQLLLSSVSKHNIWSYYDWFYCCCRPSVNTICGRVMIGWSLLYILCLLTDDSNRKPSHNTTTYCVYWRTKTTINPVLTQYVVVLWLGLLLLSSVIKHNMWSYYDLIYFCCCPSVNTICGRIMIGLVVVVYWRSTTINPIIIQPHIVFTDGRQEQ
jgi:hypothetical protein